MAYIVDIDYNDDLTRVVQKCNRNFQLLFTKQTKQGTSDLDSWASGIYSYIDERIDSIDTSGGTIMGVKGEMQPDTDYEDEENQSGYVSISLEETGEAMDWLDVQTVYDGVFNPT